MLVNVIYGGRMMNLKGRDFLTLKDYTPEEIEYLIDLAARLKDMKKKESLINLFLEKMWL